MNLKDWLGRVGEEDSVLENANTLYAATIAAYKDKKPEGEVEKKYELAQKTCARVLGSILLTAFNKDDIRPAATPEMQASQVLLVTYINSVAKEKGIHPLQALFEYHKELQITAKHNLDSQGRPVEIVELEQKANNQIWIKYSRRNDKGEYKTGRAEWRLGDMWELAALPDLEMYDTDEINQKLGVTI